MSSTETNNKNTPEWDMCWDDEESDEQRECSNSCPHYDSLNQCCWQVTEKGLCFHVSEGDLCHLGYLENDGN